MEYKEQLNMVVSALVHGPQISPSTIRKKNKSKKNIPFEAYEADLEKTEKILLLAPKKPRKLKQIQ